MLTTNSVSFSGGSRPTEFPIRSRSLLRPNRERLFCSICDEQSYIHDTKRRTVTRGEKILEICGRCNRKYHDAPGQIERFGFRFRFVKRSEISAKGAIAKQIYKILLLAKERSEIRQKEVNWMADEQTKKLLKLPNDIAKIVGQTYAVCGDDSKLADDVALMQIRDLLDDIDPRIMERQRKKKRAS